MERIGLGLTTGLGLGLTALGLAGISFITIDSGPLFVALWLTLMGAISATQVSSAWEASSSSISNASDLTDEVISGAIPEIREKEGDATAKAAGDAYLSGVTEALRIAAVGVAVAGVLAVPLLGRRGCRVKGDVGADSRTAAPS